MLLKKFSKIFPDRTGRKRRMKAEIRPLGEVAIELTELLQQVDFTDEADVMESLSKLSDSAMDYLLSYHEEVDKDGAVSELPNESLSPELESLSAEENSTLAAMAKMLQEGSVSNAPPMTFRKVDDEGILPFEETEPEGELDTSYEKMPTPVDGSFSDEDADALIERLLGL